MVTTAKNAAANRAFMVEYRKRPEVRAREKANAKASRDRNHEYQVMKKYGLTKGEYAEILEKQGGRCYICRNKPRKYRLAVDHDHVTGRVRGLLCLRCNRALGLWEGDNERLSNLIDYAREIIYQRNKCNADFGYHANPHVGCTLR